MKQVTGNVGEWSEIYALFKIISDKQLYAGDKNLNQVKGLVYPLIRVLRTEGPRLVEYLLDMHTDIVEIHSDKVKVASLAIKDFKQAADNTLYQLQHKKNISEKGSFALPAVEAFMQTISADSLKASSSTKTDITLVIHDLKTNQSPHLGFSIKSQLGNASTLLNASKATNFKYIIDGMNDVQMNSVNKIATRKKIKDRLSKIQDLKLKLRFDSIINPMFANNLTLVDSRLGEILGWLVLLNYLSDKSDLSSLVTQLEKLNPLGFDTSNSHLFYTYKIKKFLTDVAVGLMPNTTWNGQYDATGGYLVIKESGDILCYHLYNKNEFEDYLFENTKFETASTTRHEFGKVYKINSQFYMNLNLQIRFNK